MTETVLVQLHLPEPSPSLATAARKLGVAAGKLDADYGLVPVDLPAGLYAVKLDKSEASAAAARLGSGGAEGIFADVRIEPLGPPAG